MTWDDVRAAGVHVPLPPKPLKIGLMSAWNELYLPLATITAPIMEKYCERHGYTFIPGPGLYHDRVDDRVGRGDLCKSSMFQHNYANFDALMWLDIDALIMNHDIRIEDVLGERPFLWTCDVNGVCSGFWIARCQPLIRQFMQRFAFNVAYEDGGGDQDGMRRMMERPPYTFIRDNCVFGKEAGHCYPYDVMQMPKDLTFVNGYEPGDWLLTVPSIELGRRIQLLADYATKVKF